MHGIQAKHDAPQYITAKLNVDSGYRNMLWLLLEAGLALAILVFIVWWTWPKKPPGRDT
jgi:hypothetical protein